MIHFQLLIIIKTQIIIFPAHNTWLHNAKNHQPTGLNNCNPAASAIIANPSLLPAHATSRGSSKPQCRNKY